jgi:tetratricopeptide (TPR) repeat protein
MKAITLLLAIALIPGLISAQTAIALEKKADAASLKKNYRQALAYIDQAIAIDSTQAQFHYERGCYLTGLEDFNNAFYAYSKAIQLKPDLVYAYLNRGNILLSFQMVDDAISDFNVALKYSKNDTVNHSAYVNRGAAKIQKRDFEGGYKDMLYAYQMDTSDKDILVNLAAACNHLGKKDEAFKYLLIAHRALPDDPAVISNLGFMYQAQGDYKKSIEYFDLAIKIMPEQGLGYSNRSFSRLKTGDTDGAMKDINKSIELYPGNSYAYRNRALIYLELKKFGSACTDLHTAISKGYTEMYGKDVEELIDKNCAAFK